MGLGPGVAAGLRVGPSVGEGSSVDVGEMAAISGRGVGIGDETSPVEGADCEAALGGVGEPWPLDDSQ